MMVSTYWIQLDFHLISPLVLSETACPNTFYFNYQRISLWSSVRWKYIGESLSCEEQKSGFGCLITSETTFQKMHMFLAPLSISVTEVLDSDLMLPISEPLARSLVQIIVFIFSLLIQDLGFLGLLISYYLLFCFAFPKTLLFSYSFLFFFYLMAYAFKLVLLCNVQISMSV